jgi:FkbM family methyltransferase
MGGAARLAGLARSLALGYAIPFRGRRLARLYAPFLGPGRLAFDIGAHAGNRVRAFRRLGARVIAVEPQPDFARLLETLYGRDPAVTIVRAAVGRAAGTARLLVAERTPTVSTLSTDWTERVRADPSFAGVSWAPGATVAVTTLDALIEAHGEPDFVKLDVEGYEAEALAGLTRPVRALSFEYLPAAREVALACVERLAALGHYEFNWSRGESQVLARSAWLEADALRSFLDRLRPGDGSGDVYARRVRSERA